MSVDLIIALVMASLALMTLIMRTNVALAILGLCAGYVFSDLLSEEIITFIYNNNYNEGSLPVASIVTIVLTLLPGMLILYRLRQYQSGRFFQHLIPAFGFSLLATLFIFTNLPLDVDAYLREESVIFQQLRSYQVVIAASVVSIAVIDVMLHEKEQKRKYKKRFQKQE